MNFHLSEEQLELKRAARRFLEVHSPYQLALAATQSDAYDSALYQRIAQELGWTALPIPEAYGGLGMSALELYALMEEMGRHLLPSPFFATMCLATQAILLGANENQKREWLPSIAAGELRATLAVTETDSDWNLSQISTTFQRTGDGFVLNGVKRYVPDGHLADLLLVAAKETGTGQLGLFAINATASGLTRTALPTMDATRKQAELIFKNVTVTAEARIDADATSILEKTLSLASIALAAEQVGAAEMCLEMAVEYAKVRKQFNRPIGSFQAIKHRCADMLLRVESARSAAFHASAIAAHQNESLVDAASTAKAYCSEAFFFCAAENIQIHGGIGFTWEHPAHLYFKRAKSSEIFLGSPAVHRERVAQELGL